LALKIPFSSFCEDFRQEKSKLNVNTINKYNSKTIEKQKENNRKQSFIQNSHCKQERELLPVPPTAPTGTTKGPQESGVGDADTPAEHSYHTRP
jgi:hypothetical protein